MENRQFTKLSALVNDEFTIQEVHGYKFKMWDTATSRMLVSDDYEKGYSKKYTVSTDKGELDLGVGQVGSLLEAVFYNGVADLNGRTFEVKSNGKTGMEIRYYFNAKKQATQPTGESWEKAREKLTPKEDPAVNDEDMDEPINLNDIPF